VQVELARSAFIDLAKALRQVLMDLGTAFVGAPRSFKPKSWRQELLAWLYVYCAAAPFVPLPPFSYLY
jgi:hypothetical protein